MKNFIKIGIAGLTGYLIGYYGYKYKVMEAFVETMIEEKKSKEEEAQ